MENEKEKDAKLTKAADNFAVFCYMVGLVGLTLGTILLYFIPLKSTVLLLASYLWLKMGARSL